MDVSITRFSLIVHKIQNYTNGNIMQIKTIF